jgi:hypothetical protein
MPTTTQDVPRLLEGIPDDFWVAISMEANEVVAYGKDLEEVMDASRAKGEEHPLIVKAPVYRHHLAL